MVNVSSTTARALEVAVRRVVVGITPTEAYDQDRGWRASADNMVVGPALTERLFHIEWSPGEGPILGGTTGRNDFDMGAIMSIVAHYRGFDSKTLGWHVEQDHGDLVETLSCSLDPTILGLMSVEDSGWSLVGEASEQVIEHVFAVQYHRTRATGI